MRLLIPALALLLLPQDATEDVVHLQNGQTKRGTIVSEDDEKIILEFLIRNRKGKTVGSGRHTIKKSDILRIERASKEARANSLEKSQAFAKREELYKKALARIRPEPATFKGRKGLRVAGTHFEVFSTCEEKLVKEVTQSLEQVFLAYQSFFKVKARIQAQNTENRNENLGEAKIFERVESGR